jgi:hypothetical protein
MLILKNSFLILSSTMKGCLSPEKRSYSQERNENVKVIHIKENDNDFEAEGIVNIQDHK